MDDKITISAVGDLMIGDHPVRIGNGVRSKTDQIGAHGLFKHCQKYWKGSDLIFGNLEFVHSDIGLDKDSLESFEFRGSPGTIDTLKKVGFNLLNVATNHCLEHGIEAFRDSVNRIIENKIYPIGLIDDMGKSIPIVFKKGKSNTCIIGFSMRPEKYYCGQNIPYSIATESQIIDSINTYKSRYDFLVLSLHWGHEFMHYPSRKQIDFAHECIDSGVDLIIGHHAHVVQTFEIYNNGAILYSLGNFISDMWQENTKNTVLVNTVLEKGKKANIQLIPLYIDDDYSPTTKEKNKEYIIIHNIKDHCIYSSVSAERYNYLTKKKDIMHRITNYIYFISHFYKYRKIFLAQSLKRFLIRKFESDNTSKRGIL
jgi:gamma-polyglutamate biosynthesis protein CapA